MKLKGKNSKRISKAKKKKMEKTLKKMEETRKQDSIFLRDLIQKKLKWAKEQKEKETKVFDKAKQNIIALNGAIITLKELLQAKSDDVDNKA